MIKGIGIDIVEVMRVKEILRKYDEHFIKRVFTQDELITSAKKKEPWIFLSGRFAVKEAVFKAFGTGMAKGMTFKDVELVNQLNGKPEVNLYGKAKEFADESGINKVFVSLSHENDYAVAFVVMEG